MIDWVNNSHSDGAVDIRMDRALMLVVAILCAFGLVMIASASVSVAHEFYGDAFHFLRRQSVYFLLAMVVGIGVYHFVSCERWLSNSGVILLVTSVLLVLVLLIGDEIKGSQRWLDLGIFSVQPSELAKLAIIIFVADYITRHGSKVRQSFQAFAKPIAISVIIAGLLVLEPDYGTAVFILFLAAAMLFLAGAKLIWFASYAVSGGVILGGLLVSSEYRLKRWQTYLDGPLADSYDTGYQLTQAWIGMVNGSWFGSGLGNSVAKLLYVPEPHTDFILTIIVEELGFIAALFLVLAYLVIVFRCFVIGKRAFRQQQAGNAYLAYGIGIWLGVQAFTNIAVVLGVLPTTGIPLPLISIGGSSLLVTLIAIAIVQRVHYEACHADKLLMRRYQQT